MGTKKVRKGPTASATAFSVGTKKKVVMEIIGL